MALTTYTELKAAVADWLNRGDLTSVIPDFITLAEQDIERDVRSEVVRAAFSLDSAAVALPAAVGELRNVRHNSTLYRGNIDLVTPESLNDFRVAWGQSTGTPRWASVVDGTLLLVPSPDQTYTAEIIYFEALTPLSGSVASNGVLAAAPDVYLFGSLYNAAIYLQHDERAGLFKSRYDDAVFKENLRRENTELGASPRPMRLPVVFGE